MREEIIADFVDGLSIRENKFPRKKFFSPLIREKFKKFSFNHKSYEEFCEGINNHETDNFITRTVHLFRKIRKMINKI